MLRRPAPVALNRRPARAFTAASRVLDPTDRGDVAAVKKRRAGWQAEAWTYYDEIGEVKYGGQFHAKALRKVRVFPAVRVDPDEAPIPLDDLDDVDPEHTEGIVIPDNFDQLRAAADDALARLDEGAEGGLGALQSRFAINRFVAGETWLTITERADLDDAEWVGVLSTDELVNVDGKLWLKLDPDWRPDQMIPLPDGFLARFWTQHPRWSERPDSPLRGVLDICETLYLMTAEVRGASGSRLNNGLLLFPDSMFREPAESDDVDLYDAGDGQVDGLDAGRSPTVEDLLTHFEAGIKDPRAASVVSPFVMTADPEDIAAVKHLTFDRPHDAQAAKDRDDLLRRLANGIDLPVEVLLGMGDVNHWTAWQVSRETFTAHIEPGVLDWCEFVSSAYWRPALAAQGYNLATLPLTLWYDASDLVQKPDQTNLAWGAHDRLIISDDAARRMTGIPDEFAPDDEEAARRERIRIGTTPGRAPEDTDPPTGETTPEAPPAPSGGGLTAAAPARVAAVGRVLAAIDASLLARLTVAADSAVSRALERAGARARTKATRASAAHADLLAAVPNPAVAATLGPGLLAALDAPTEWLLAGSLDDLQGRYDQWVSRAQALARDQLADLVDDEDVIADLQAEQDEARGAGWVWLAAALGALLTARVFDPSPKAEPGEFDATLAVPAGLLREALVIAGGDAAPATVTPRSVLSSTTGDPVGGVATGPDVEQVLLTVGFRRRGYEWVYGDPGSRTTPFEPHANLDGVEFSRWDDDVLANNDDWPDGSHYYPGDHLWCQCSFVPLYEGDEGEGPNGGE